MQYSRTTELFDVTIHTQIGASLLQMKGQLANVSSPQSCGTIERRDLRTLLGGLCVLAMGCGGTEGMPDELDGGGNVTFQRNALGTWSAVTVDLFGVGNFSAQGGYLLSNFGNTPKHLEYAGQSYPGYWDTIPGGNVASTGTRMSMTARRWVKSQGQNVATEEHVFTRAATGGHVIHQQRTDCLELCGYEWNTGWDNSVGTNGILGAPSVAENGSTHHDFDVFVRGTDNNIHINTYSTNNSNNTGYNPGTTGSWSGYSGLSAPSGGLSSGTSPSSASALGTVTYPERDVFVQNASNSLSWRYWKGSTWSSWITVAWNPFIGSPVAINSSASNAIDVYVMGTDGNVYRNRMTITNPNTSGTTRTYSWSGYVGCGKPSGVTLDTGVLAVGRTTEGGVFETKIFVKDTSGYVYKASGECT